MKYLVLIFLAMFSGCGPCNPETYDMGPLSEEALQLVPYENGSTFSLTHSKGLKINFTVFRSSEFIEDNFCAECCDIFIYEENTCRLVADHPVLNSTITINNYDSLVHYFSIYIDKAGFMIPASDTLLFEGEKHDSMLIGSNIYYDVLALKYEESYYGYSSNENPITVDSLYYNYSNGILKISMSNDEYYQISN